MSSPGEQLHNHTDSDSDEFNLEGQEALEHILDVASNDEFEFDDGDDGAKYVLEEDSDEFDNENYDSVVDKEASLLKKDMGGMHNMHLETKDFHIHQSSHNDGYGLAEEASFANTNNAMSSQRDAVEERVFSTNRHQFISNHDATKLEVSHSETHDSSQTSIPTLDHAYSSSTSAIPQTKTPEIVVNPQVQPMDLEQVRNQWASVNSIRESQGYGKDPVRGFDNIEEAPIRASDAYTLLQKHSKFEEFVNNESTAEEKSLLNFISKVTLGACGNASLKKYLTREKRELLAVCKIPLDLTDTTHIRMMATLYKKLTGEKYNCPMIGPHWEQLGFQRPNPQTDLRDAGMFGIVQLLYFLERGKDIPLHLLHLSQTKGIDFPFCVVSLNMTAISKGLLRSGRLNAIINKRKSVEEAMNIAYMSIFYDFYLTWKRGDKTIYDYGSVKKEIEKQAEKNIEKWIARLEKNVLSSRFEGAEKIDF